MSTARTWSSKISCRRRKGNQKTLVQLVGGADPSFDQEERSQQNNSDLVSSSKPPSEPSPQTSHIKEPFITKVLNQKGKFLSTKETEERIRNNLKHAMMFLQKITSQSAPALLAVSSLLGSGQNDVSYKTLYALSLLGASCGFHLFLHFITLGYALGVTFPVCASFYFYSKHYVLPLPTILHSSITILWGVRLFSFLAIREYVTWPALHHKVVEVQSKMNIPFASKILCWFVYSFFYLSLMASCWSRLVQSKSSSNGWGLVGFAGLSIQLIGLILETVADLQKNAFKSNHRHSWCNVGVWKLSTHPNYLGEGIFWAGSYLAHGFHSPVHSILATIGLALILFLLKGSAKSLSSKQKEKYGQEICFHQFQRTHNVFGPKHIWKQHQRRAQILPNNTTITTEVGSHSNEVKSKPSFLMKTEGEKPMNESL